MSSNNSSSSSTIHLPSSLAGSVLTTTSAGNNITTTYIPSSLTSLTGATTAATGNCITYYPTTGGTVGWSLSDITYATYEPVYSDLLAGLYPGTAWFKKGTIVSLQFDHNFSRKENIPYECSIFLKTGSTMVYLGVVEDLVMGRERHYFLSSTGEILQHAGLIGNLGWRESMRKYFKVLGD